MCVFRSKIWNFKTFHQEELRCLAVSRISWDEHHNKPTKIAIVFQHHLHIRVSILQCDTWFPFVFAFGTLNGVFVCVISIFNSIGLPIHAVRCRNLSQEFIVATRAHSKCEATENYNLCTNFVLVYRYNDVVLYSLCLCFGVFFSSNSIHFSFFSILQIVSLTELMAGVKAPTKTVQLFQLTCFPLGHKVNSIQIFSKYL